jgi:aryl-alcohol dehydrogenase-like predicted oxidoreductase
VIPWCATNGTGVIVYSPMQSGLLTGSFSAQRAAALPADDWRARHPDFRGEGLTRNLAVAGALTSVAEARGISTAEVAIAWVLGFEGVTAAIVGARRPEQIDGWSTAGSVTLTPVEYAEIALAIDSVSAGSGPSAPLTYLQS